MNYTTGRTIVLRNDPQTQENIKIGIESEVWGSRFAGVNAEVKSGESCVFLIGVSIANLQELKKDENFKSALTGFPNIKNENLTNQLLENIQFNVEEVLYGETTSDWYVDESEIWSPKETLRKRKHSEEKEVTFDFYKNRFRWRFTHKAVNQLVSKDTFNTSFMRSIVLSLRDKCVAPFQVEGPTKVEELKSAMILKTPSSEEEFQNLAQEANKIALPSGPIEKPKKPDGKTAGRWSRSASVASTALKNANHLCEINKDHISFISQSTNRNYMEAHHLIPMEFQGQFQYSLDVPDNIVSLCSNCHNKIHYAIKEDKKQLVEQLFQKRMSGLESRKIPVELDKLMKYYGI